VDFPITATSACAVSRSFRTGRSDQGTIAGLRHEFEKGWKPVEISQDQENRSREVIDQLKAKSSNDRAWLNKAVQWR
jgi:hypothetical protein